MNTHDSRSRRLARAAERHDYAAVAARWESTLAAEGMPDRLPMLDARHLSPAIADAITAHSDVLADELSTDALIVRGPSTVQMLRDSHGRLTRRIGFTRVETDMAVTVARRADGKYGTTATVRRVPCDALVTVESSDITEHTAPHRAPWTMRQVDVMARGLTCTGAPMGSDAWTDNGERYCAVSDERASDALIALLATAPTWNSGTVWHRVTVAEWITARLIVAAEKLAEREARRVPRDRRAEKKTKRVRAAKGRPIGSVRLVDRGNGLTAARARWKACKSSERADVCASFGLSPDASWDTVRAAAVSSFGTSTASLADAMAQSSVAGLAVRVG